MEWTIRKAVKEDEPQINALFKEMLRSVYSIGDAEGYEAGYLDKFFTNGDRNDWICAAEANGSIVGYLSIEVHHEPESFIYLDDLSVTENFRGMGIGTKLIKTAEGFAEKLNIPAVVLHVEKTNKSAFRLYERLGYSILNDENTLLCMNTRFRMIKRVLN